MTWLLEPLAYPFMLRALLAAFLVSVTCGVVGTYVVLRGMAFLGDALAHSILPGVVVAFLLGWPLAVGALIVGIGSAFGIGLLSERGHIREDAAIGIVFAATFALGVALISTTGSYATDLAHILFGNVLGVSTGDLWFIAIFSALVLATLLLLYKEFLVLTFDPMLATVLRLPARFLRYLLLLLTAVSIVVALQTVGVALVIALLVTPASTALLLAQRLPVVMVLSAAAGALASVIGLYASYYLNIASGPAIVLAATALFALAFLFAPQRGLLWTSRQNRALQTVA